MKEVMEGKKRNPKISACMIVRNEENFLPRCLHSIRDYVDEIVIVDTGSTDRTVRIAESFGARVYHHPWEDHFSKHRNQSLGYAKGDWILYIDADEEMIKGSGETLRRGVCEAPEKIDAIAVVMECVFDQGKSRAYNNAIRVFRNRKEIFFKGRVHNYLVGIKNVICCPIHIFHHGYNLDQEGRSRKFERTTRLLKKDIADDPLDPRPHHFLAASYLSEGMHEEALEEARKAISLFERKNGSANHNYYWSLYIAATAALRMGRKDEARRLAEKGARLCPNHLDSHYILCLAAYEDRDRHAFENHLRNFLAAKESFVRNPEHFGEMVHNTIGSQWQLHLLMAFLFFDEAMEGRAQEEIKAALGCCPDPAALHSTLGAHFLRTGRLRDSEYHLLKASELRPDDGTIQKSLACLYEKLGRNEERALRLQKATQIDPGDFQAWFDLGFLHLNGRQLNEAERAFRRAQEIDPMNPEPIINRAVCLNEMGRFEQASKILEQIRPSARDTRKLVLVNLAISHMGMKRLGEAAEALREVERLDSESLEVPVLLALIHLEKGDVEACVMDCDRIYTLLNMKRNIIVNCMEDLAYLYLSAGMVLVRTPERTSLARICFDISLTLSNNSPPLIAEIGVALMDIGQIKDGARILKSALLLAPSDQKIRKVVEETILPETDLDRPA